MIKEHVLGVFIGEVCSLLCPGWWRWSYSSYGVRASQSEQSKLLETQEALNSYKEMVRWELWALPQGLIPVVIQDLFPVLGLSFSHVSEIFLLYHSLFIFDTMLIILIQKRHSFFAGMMMNKTSVSPFLDLCQAPSCTIIFLCGSIIPLKCKYLVSYCYTVYLMNTEENALHTCCKQVYIIKKKWKLFKCNLMAIRN